MRDAGSGGDGFFCMAERLIGKALVPEDKARKGVASRAAVESVTSSFGAVALWIVELEALF
jgi:hypothetical protein